MTAKEYLGQVRRLDAQIDADMQEACHLRRQAEKAKSIFCGEVKSSAVEDALVRLAKLEDAAINDIHRLVQIREDVKAVIEQLSVPEERLVLQLRYLCGKKWEEICVSMGYEWAQTHRFHANALCEIENMIHNDTLIRARMIL